ncbi:MAG: hypothetical protein CMA21_01400 [Euryarchaeota archaeon]|nr:hypothetical protein [Euryarchaeota archaeon]
MPINSKYGKVNFTGRTRIDRSRFKLKVLWGEEYVRHKGYMPVIERESFWLDLPEDYPPETKVFLDVTHQNNYQHFDLGTKGDLRLPDSLVLDEIGQNQATFEIRAIDPSNGMLIGRSSPYPVRPPKDKPNSKKRETFQLLRYSPADLDRGIPMMIEFPKITGSNDAIKILINRSECESLWYALEENEPVPKAFILPGYLSCIAERLVSDYLAEAFDPEEEATRNSSWQTHWNHLFRGWTGRGVGQIDVGDPVDIQEWVKDIIYHWGILSGHPAKVIQRHIQRRN